MGQDRSVCGWIAEMCMLCLSEVEMQRSSGSGRKHGTDGVPSGRSLPFCDISEIEGMGTESGSMKAQELVLCL